MTCSKLSQYPPKLRKTSIWQDTSKCLPYGPFYTGDCLREVSYRQKYRRPSALVAQRQRDLRRQQKDVCERGLTSATDIRYANLLIITRAEILGYIKHYSLQSCVMFDMPLRKGVRTEESVYDDTARYIHPFPVIFFGLHEQGPHRLQTAVPQTQADGYQSRLCRTERKQENHNQR
jgi:hypothetical protein